MVEDTIQAYATAHSNAIIYDLHDVKASAFVLATHCAAAGIQWQCPDIAMRCTYLDLPDQKA